MALVTFHSSNIAADFIVTAILVRTQQLVAAFGTVHLNLAHMGAGRASLALCIGAALTAMGHGGFTGTGLFLHSSHIAATLSMGDGAILTGNAGAGYFGNRCHIAAVLSMNQNALAGGAFLGSHCFGITAVAVGMVAVFLHHDAAVFHGAFMDAPFGARVTALM
jgi:hypothetical protein